VAPARSLIVARGLVRGGGVECAARKPAEGRSPPPFHAPALSSQCQGALNTTAAPCGRPPPSPPPLPPSSKRNCPPPRALQVEQITQEQLEVVIADREKPIIVDFFATWCGPCVMLAKELEKVRGARALGSLTTYAAHCWARRRRGCCARATAAHAGGGSLPPGGSSERAACRDRQAGARLAPLARLRVAQRPRWRSERARLRPAAGNQPWSQSQPSLDLCVWVGGGGGRVRHRSRPS
jgi:hypothetical protein